MRTGVARIAIQRVCQGWGSNPSAGGFFWRYKGGSELPWAVRGKSCCKAVEQISVETGEVLAQFASLSEAKKGGREHQHPGAERLGARECRRVVLALEGVSECSKGAREGWLARAAADGQRKAGAARVRDSDEGRGE